ncbi:fungal-specific transcription factor domain-containing protein [Stachybotrys elegans]|uniref:Fungal-specific transcription factor domain-containing protein n=1 Tax=Stachybotrys elegans TaxID=80388 RepID=A0A8K0WSQ0_9HYPO|nr:fungal-specific transcription factor domain-containing protein [Stachybotrys elegans]
MAEESRAPSQRTTVEPDISNPIHEPHHVFVLDQASHQQYVGDSTCVAFGDRVLQCLNPQSVVSQPSPRQYYVHNPAFARQLGSPANCKLPERIRANLLVRVALRFIGSDYHFFLHHDFMQSLDKAYQTNQNPEHDSTWLCKFFAVLALGEMYSTALPGTKDTRSVPVPGAEYFVTAVNLLQDSFEEPSVAQIETMLLFCFYSNALGRVKSAHMYSGIAVRMSTSLGLHRANPADSAMSPMEREHRVRLWWTVYVFERSTSSRLGQPLTIQDSDIDVGLPSSNISTPQDQPKLGSPEHLIAHINLAQITGYIMRHIYSPSSKSNDGRFVHNVRTILQKLRRWDANLPAHLRWNPQGGVPRSTASLQLHFHQCIILTTRPILLYVLKIKNPFAVHTPGSIANCEPPIMSDTTKSLADSCISAARTSNSILSQLFVENALATCGYFDAHHLFASTLVLIVSAITSPNSGDSDAVQTAFQLLLVMRDNGNAAAGQYFSRLAQIQWSVSRLFARLGVEEHTPASNVQADNVPSIAPSDPPPSVPMEFDDYDWGNFFIPPFNANYDQQEATNVNIVTEPLDNPLLQAFLDYTDAGTEGNPGTASDETGFMLH